MLRRSALSLAITSAAALTLTAFPAAPAVAAGTGAAAVTALALPAAPTQVGANGARTGCTAYKANGGWVAQCHTASDPGGGSGGGGAQKCTWSANVNQFFPHATNFLPPAPQGFIYLVQLCGHVFAPPQLLAIGGAATPAALAQQALQELRPPLPIPETAPPRASGHGLVGAPEWFWVPAHQWAPLHARAATPNGAVWAVVTATPQRLTISPGGGLPAQACPGPGIAYSPSVPLSAACTYTYATSSASQPGAAYQVTVTITWAATWHGSGGTGGPLPALSTSATFPLRVAEGQALNNKDDT